MTVTALPQPQQTPAGGKSGGGKPSGQPVPQPQPMPVNKPPITGGGPLPKPGVDLANQQGKPLQRLPAPTGLGQGGKAGGGKPGGSPNPINPIGPQRGGGKPGGNGLTLADIQRPMPMVNLPRQQPQPMVQNQQQITTPSGS